MNVKEAYKRFLLKVNKNDTNTKVVVGPAEFCLIYNEQSLRWLGEKIKSRNSLDDINDLEQLLKHDVELKKVGKDNNHEDFTLPDDFFKYSSSFSLVQGSGCNVKVDHFLVHPKEKNSYWADAMTRPSLEWEETFVVISDNQLQVFVDEFTNQFTYIDYWRNPAKIDMIGYIHPDGSLSSDVDPELSDQDVNEIISRCAIESFRSYENPEAFQLAKDRVITE